MKKISLCITNYNRNAYLFKSFEQVLNDERIGEVVIVDDCSDPDIYKAIEERCKYMPKVKLFRNEVNLDVYANKREAVSKAKYEYVILFDSDNVIATNYLDQVYLLPHSKTTIFAPDFAMPVFDYRKFAGLNIKRSNVHEYCFKPGFDCLINTMNYFVNRDEYLSIWQPKDGIIGADSIYMNYLWLSAGNSIYVVPSLTYFHRVNDFNKGEHGSNYVKHAQKSEPLCKGILKQMSELR